MLYCDAIIDAMNKGLGKQKICVRYNILTAALDVTFLFLLLPKYGMSGYFFSFLVTHAVNFALSIRRLLIITGQRIPLHIPLLTIAAGIASAWFAGVSPSPAGQITAFPLILGSLLYLLGIIRREDIRWMAGLVRRF